MGNYCSKCRINYGNRDGMRCPNCGGYLTAPAMAIIAKRVRGIRTPGLG